MFCSKCGKELKEGDAFCPICGTKVILDEAVKPDVKKADNKNAENEQTIIKREKKKKFPFYIIIIIVLILVIVFLLINFNLFRKKIRNSGHFEKIDGVDTYIENGEIVVNSLVRIRGRKIYYVDEKGHKKKNIWEVIDNDGNWGYFGSLGELVVNKKREIEGKEYYFDENGKLLVDGEVEINGIKYKSNSKGELYTLDEYKEVETVIQETIIGKTTQNFEESEDIQMTQEIQTIAPIQQTQVVPTTQYVQQTYITPVQTQAAQVPVQASAIVGQPPMADNVSQTQTQVQQTTTYIDMNKYNEIDETTTKRPPLDGRAEVVETENPGPGAGITNTYKKSYVTEEDDEDYSDDEEMEIKIKSTEKISDTVDDDEYECKITLVKPIMQGKNSEETDALNGSIDELMDVLWDEVESVVNDYDTLPKSVTFTSPTLGTTSKTKILINLSGTITPRSGSSKSIKYRITYDRAEENGDIAKVS